MRMLANLAVCSVERQRWVRWFECVESMRATFFSDYGSFDPIYYNETATVGLLVAAAGRASLLALPEFTEARIKRKHGSRLGRHDLWLVDPTCEISWLFEFKMCWCTPGTKKRMLQSYNDALHCAQHRHAEKAERRVACTVYVPFTAGKTYSSEKFSTYLARIAALRQHADLSVEITGSDRPAHFLFHFVDDGRKMSKYMVHETDFFD